MKYLLLILFLFISITSFTQRRYGVDRRIPLQTRASTIVYFGDSFSVNVPPDGGTAYPFKIFAFNGITKRNYATGGTSVCTGTYAPTGSGNNLIDIYTTETAIGYQGQIVFFAYAQNDGALINASWKAVYKSIIQAFITAGFPTNRLVIQAQPNHSSNATGTRATARQYELEISQELGILFNNVYQAFIDTGVGDTLWGNVNTHPTNAGELVWAQTIFQFLTR